MDLSVTVRSDADSTQYLDSRRISRYEEGRQSVVRVTLRFGDHHYDCKRAVLKAAGEPFLAVDHPLVAVQRGSRPVHLRISTALRLGCREARDDLTLEEGLEIQLPLLVSPELGDDLGVSRVRRLTP